MADDFGARIDAKYSVVYCAMDICLDVSFKPIPFPIQETLDHSAEYSAHTNFNGLKSFLLKSYTTKVTGDILGVNKGIVSKTVASIAEPIEPYCSQSFRIEKSPVIRVGDIVLMNSKNTFGKVVFQDAPKQPDITDKGKIKPSSEEKSMFDELKDWMAGGLETVAKVATTAQSVLSAINKGGTHTPVATAVTGALGSMLGSPVILRTGQLLYTEALISLTGSMPILLNLHYVAREAYTGIFGNHWFFEYETRFIRIPPTKNNAIRYRLYLCDGRKFDFIHNQENNTLEDHGNFGVDIQWDKQCFTLTYHNEELSGITEVYQHDKLIKRSDRNGNSLALSYDEYGRLIQIKNNSDAFFNISYHNKTKLASQLQDQSGRSWQFNYDKASNLNEVITPLGGQRFYTYQHFAERNNSYAYLLRQVKNSLQHPLFNASYNQAGQVASYRELEESIEYQYSYFDGKTIAKTSEQGENCTYHLDQHGRVDSITLESGATQSLEWNATALTAIITTYSKAKEIKIFDQQQRLVKQIDTTGKETLYQYKGRNPEPNLIKLQTGEIKNRYDANYNLLSTTDEKDRTEKYAYNNRGDITEITDAAGNKTRYQYNAFSQPEAIIDGKGNTTKIEYDELGREQKLIDAEGRETCYIYNEKDEVVTVRTPLQTKIKFEFDPEGQLLSITDPAGNISRYTYDAQGRLIRELKPNGKSKSYNYLENSLLRTLTYEDGTRSDYQYNDLGQLTQETIGDITTTYEYDHNHQLTKACSPTSTIEFSYTKTGKLERQIQDGMVVDRAYTNDQLSNLDFLNNNVLYVRKKDGSLINIHINESEQAIEQHYRSDDQLVKRIYPNQQSEIFDIDDSGSFKSIETAGINIPYEMDKNGTINRKGLTQYEYDNSDRLIKVNHEVFSYNVSGNLIHSTEKTIDGQSRKNAYRYDPQTNQLLENSTHLFSYDARGNLQTKTHKATESTQYYQYNAKTQLTNVYGQRYDEKTQCLVKVNLSFKYDAIGRRVEKLDGSTREQYLYDQFNIVGIATYHKNKDRQLAIITYDDEEIDTPLSISNENGTFYYHRDHQGSIIALTNKNGDIVESIKYDDSYGKIIEHQRIVETNNPFCFTGREFDAEDLYYYRARYYDPTIKHFLSEDPIGFLSGDYNHYRYVDNNPANLNDPFGLCPPCVAGLWHLGRIAVTYGAKKLIQRQAAKKLAKKLADEAKELAKEEAAALAAAGVTAVAGAVIKGPDLECGEVGTFQMQNAKTASGTEKNGNMERDHIPQTQYMREKAKKMQAYKGLNQKGKKCVYNGVRNRAKTIAIPVDMHKTGRTGSKNTNVWKDDMGSTPKQVADKDIKHYERMLEGKDLSADEQKSMETVSSECKKEIQKGLDKMKKEKFNNFLNDVIKKCKKNQSKKSTRRRR